MNTSFQTTSSLTDGYKLGHREQYQKGTTQVIANWTPRKSRIEGIEEVVFFGQQAFIKKYLIEQFNEDFFGIPEDKAVAKYYRRVRAYLPPDIEVSTDHIRDLHRLGYLPIMILSLPEGVSSPIRVPQSVLMCTKPEFFWLTNYFETLYSCEIWMPCTSATIAKQYRKILDHYAMLTVGNTEFVAYQGHDFSFIGMANLDAAMASGGAHLLSFNGTDTIPAIDWLEHYYNADCEKEIIGVSIPATEHAIMSSSTGFYIWDKFKGDWSYQGEAELEVFKRLITETYPHGFVSIVCDTWDLWKVLTEYVRELKDLILARNGKVVFRPDSGNPVDIICGKKIQRFNSVAHAKNKLSGNMTNSTEPFTIDGKYYEAIAHGGTEFKYSEILNPAPELKGVVKLLWEVFGGTETETGYKLLDSHVGCIYGDSITMDRATEICYRLMLDGFASINWVAGIGSYTYQYQTRDTFGYAMKSTYCEVGEYKIPIFKDPITDDGTKKSAKGIVAVYKDENGIYYLKDQATMEELMNCELKPVFKDGVLLKDFTLQEVRDNIKAKHNEAITI